MAEMATLSIVQMKIKPGEVKDNLKKARTMVEKAVNRGSDIALLPEMFSTGFHYDNHVELSKTSSWVIKTMKELSRNGSIFTVFSVPERKEGNIYNCAYVLGKDGTIKGKYRKVHLFGLFREDRYFSGGKDLSFVNAGRLKIAPIICYDLRFPELSRKAALKGADLLAYCSQWPEERIDHWFALLKARAIENQVFVAGANGCGRSGKISLGGNSVVFSPTGNVVGKLGKGEGLLTVTIDLSEIAEFRRLIPCLKDRVPEAY